jgi:hypothetical protein
VVAIPGASSVEQLESNAAAAQILLTDDEYGALQRASAWSCHIAASPPSFRGKASEIRRSVRGGKYLAMTLWHDVKLKYVPEPVKK